MSIRSTRASDLAQLRRCAEAAYGKYVQRMDRAPAPMGADFEAQIEAGKLYVRETGAGSIDGFICLYARADHLHVESVAVFPERAGRGIGGKLLAFAEEAARRRGLSAIELYTNEKMTENLTLYPHLGYTETGRSEESGHRRVFYRKEIEIRRPGPGE